MKRKRCNILMISINFVFVLNSSTAYRDDGQELRILLKAIIPSTYTHRKRELDENIGHGPKL